MNLLTPEEVAALLKIKPRQFKERVQFQRGFPRPILVAKSKRWAQESLEEWVRKQID